MEPEEKKVGPRKSRWLKPRSLAVISVVGAVIILLITFSPNGATYEEYVRLKEGMSRPKVVAIIGEADYWHHDEGGKDVTNWVNKNGTYIRAVFDEHDVLVEVSWESGWNPAWEQE